MPARNHDGGHRTKFEVALERSRSPGDAELRQHDPAGGAGAQGRHSLQGAATTSTSCCATSPRWALLSAGHRAKSSASTATTRAPRARQKEVAAKPERPMPMANAAPKAAPKAKAKAAPRPLTGCALQAAIKQGDYSHLCLSWGPLRIVDSMNASMIDDLRACTHKQLPELFPLMASLHPELQTTDSPPALQPGTGVGLHPAQAAHALQALLRRRGVGDARGVGAALLRQCAGREGGERRGPPAGRQHRLSHGVESYRDSFQAQSGLDPIHYSGIRHAARGAWDAMLRHSVCETPIHLITDEQAYKDVRSSVMGGLSCIFQPFAQANNPELGEQNYNPSAGSRTWTSTPCTRPQ